MRVKQDDKHWVVTKSLQDFAQLSRELEKQYPNLCPSESAAILREKAEPNGQQDPAKQLHLEQFLKVASYLTFRSCYTMRVFVTLKVFAISSASPKSSPKRNRLVPSSLNN